MIILGVLNPGRWLDKPSILLMTYRQLRVKLLHRKNGSALLQYVVDEEGRTSFDEMAGGGFLRKVPTALSRQILTRFSNDQLLYLSFMYRANLSFFRSLQV